MEIAGEMVVKLTVKSYSELDQLIQFYQQFGARPKVTETRKGYWIRHSKEETQRQIIDTLQAEFGKSAFQMKDAQLVVKQKLDRRAKTVQLTVKWAIDEGILIRKGMSYYFTEFVQEKIMAKLGTVNNEPVEMGDAELK
jgi:hypothetical protein